MYKNKQKSFYKDVNTVLKIKIFKKKTVFQSFNSFLSTFISFKQLNMVVGSYS